MAIDQYKVDIGFSLMPTWRDLPPLVKVRLDAETLWHEPLSEMRNFELSRQLKKGTHSLEISLLDKPDLDTHQALTISDLSFGRIHSQRFVWQATYSPKYPEPWASQQRAKGIQLQSQLTNTDHLGWNGVWELEFDVPVFTWIHRVENLGWIYD